MVKKQPGGDLGSSLGCLGALVLVALGLVAGANYLWERHQRAESLLWRVCPFGSALVGSHPPDAVEQWCQESTPEGSYRRHGVTRQWYRNGQIKAEGIFVHGKRSKPWMCWAINGEQRAPESCLGGRGNVSFPAAKTLLYTLRAGESPWAIAEAYKVDVYDILRASGLASGEIRKLENGSQVEIPVGPSSEVGRLARQRDGSDADLHTILPNESLWDIAYNHGVGVADLMAANGLDGEQTTTLRAGMRLIIPEPPKASAHARRALELAKQLDLGTLEAAKRLLEGRPDPKWINAADRLGAFPGTLRWPVQDGWLIRGFDVQGGGKGLLIGGKIGWNVRASAPGIVGYSDKLGDLGLAVLLVHPGGWVTSYVGNSVNFVTAGESVQRGGVLAEVGTEPAGKVPGIRFGLFSNGQACDPAPLMRPGVQEEGGKIRPLNYTLWNTPNDRPKAVACVTAVEQRLGETALDTRTSAP